MRRAVARLLLGCAACALALAEEPVQTTASGIKYQCLRAGTPGTEPKPGDEVAVHYLGTFADGRKFDSSRDHGTPFTFEVGAHRVIPGWDEMLPLCQVGSKYKAVIPWAQAYGEQGMPPAIPAKTDLTFEIELLKVTKGEPLPVFAAGHPEKQRKTASGLVVEDLIAGQGEPARADQGVSLRWALWSTDGRLLGCSKQSGGLLGGLAHDLRLGRFELKFLPEAALLLKPGGSVRLEVPAALAWGKEGLGQAVAPDAVTVWQLDLVKVTDLPAFSAPAAGKSKTTASGIVYEVVKPGAGAHPGPDSRVTVHYSGWLTDGTLFDSSYARGETIEFPLNGVIAGWTEGVQLMQPGAVFRFKIPGKLAYGDHPQPGSKIPPNADLIFQVELIEVAP